MGRGEIGIASASGSAELGLELSAMSDSAENGILGSRLGPTPIGSGREVVATLAAPAYLLLPLSWARAEENGVIRNRAVKMKNNGFLMRLSPDLFWGTFDQKVFP